MAGTEVQILSANGSFNAEIFHVKICGGHMVLWEIFCGGEILRAELSDMVGWWWLLFFLQYEVGMG